jgi:hypothetical protein
MKFMKRIRAAARALPVLFFAMLLPGAALAQVVTQLPVYINNNVGSVYDFGNGPLELRVLVGSFQLATEQGSGLGSTSGSSTALTLAATAAANPPCVGCIISGAGITSGTTVSAFNGTTGITLSAAMTVAASTPLAWGVACPSTPGTTPVIQAQAGVGGDMPLYTQARICGWAQFGVGATILPFAIGAH